MLVVGVVGVVVVVAIIVAVVVRSRSQDEAHSVEHYHRQLHTLEEIGTHTPPAREGSNGDHGDHGDIGEDSYPARAFRVSGSSAVRLTEPGFTLVPPAPPPPVPNPAEPLQFDDNDDGGGPESVPATFMTGSRDKAMDGINHRPRRLGGPIAAIAAVVVLVVVLVVTGLHSSNTNNHHKSATTPTTHSTKHGATQSTTHGTTHTTTQGTAHGTTHGTHAATHRPHATSTTTTAPPVVSAAQAVSTHAATYQVAASSYSLVLAATSGECWVEATNATTGAVLFTTTLFSGQSHTIPATGDVTVIAGAPGGFAATVNGAAVTLPLGNQAPFTLHFVTAGVGAAGGTAAGSTGSTGQTGSTGTTTSTPSSTH